MIKNFFWSDRFSQKQSLKVSSHWELKKNKGTEVKFKFKQSFLANDI